jgi:hypothetical protein
MWSLYEPLHDVTYFAPEAREHFERVGLRGYWRGYFAGRSAPLGAADAAPVIAAFFNFAPSMVRRALPDIWSRATPAEALAARLSGATAALERVLNKPDVTEAADSLMAAANHAVTTGRVLAAANQALPTPEQPLARLWHATTILREHRGDGHVAALVAWDLHGCDALVWRSSLDLSRDALQPNRGWTDDEWQESVRRLQKRGWLDADGNATEAAATAHREVEAVTDRIARHPWDMLGANATERLTTLLIPLARAAHRELPRHNPTGLPSPPGS